MKRLVLILLIFFCSLVTVQAEDKYPYTFTDTPEVNSEYLYLVDADSKQILMEKNSSERMYPASMTKVMSCIIAIEKIDNLNQSITMTSAMFNGLKEANASVAGLRVNDVVTVEDLLYCALLPSGADAIYALAYTISDSLDSFVELMNQKAEELGMNNTHFTNPTGLHNDNHYSTAIDMAKMLEYAVSIPEFVKVSSSASYTTTSGLTVYSSLFRFLNTDIPGLKGGKTGYTGPAGRCLASYGNLNDINLLLVTGKASGTNHLTDANTIYSWIDQSVTRTLLVDSGNAIGTIRILDGKNIETLTFYPDSSYLLDLPLSGEIRIDNTLPETVIAPIEEGTVIGSYDVYVDNQLLYHQDIITQNTIKRSFIRYLIRQIKQLFE